MIRNFRALILGAFVAGTIIGCATRPQVTWDQGKPWFEDGVREGSFTKFVYHPNAKTYYDPFAERFFWFEDGSWRAGPVLPFELDSMADIESARIVMLRDELPFKHHESVLASHPCRKPIPAKWDPDAPRATSVTAAATVE